MKLNRLSQSLLPVLVLVDFFVLLLALRHWHVSDGVVSLTVGAVAALMLVGLTTYVIRQHRSFTSIQR